MGWLSNLFGKSDGGEPQDGAPTGDKTINKLHKKLMNKYIQTMERKRVIGTLADIGSEEAITALLDRFTYVTDGSIVDEDEKSLTYDVIRSMGERAVPVLKNVITTQVAIYWPLKALTEISGEEEAVKVLFEALDGIEDRFERSMERMTNLVSSLRDYTRPEVLRRLIELATDEAEEIRFLAVDGLCTFGEYQDAVDAVVQRVADPEETIRINRYAMDMAIERSWNVKRYKKNLQDSIPEGYFVDDTGVIQRRF